MPYRCHAAQDLELVVDEDVLEVRRAGPGAARVPAIPGDGVEARVTGGGSAPGTTVLQERRTASRG